MKVPSVRAWRDSLLAGVLAFAATAVLAAAGFTAEERKFVDGLPRLFQAECESGTAQALATPIR